MDSHAYRRYGGAVSKLAIAGGLCVLTFIADLGQVVIVIAGVVAFLGVIEVATGVRLTEDEIFGDMIPANSITQREVTGVSYARIYLAGPRSIRIGVFVIRGLDRKVVLVPRYGFFRHTRRDLFRRLEVWCRQTNAELPPQCIDALAMAQR